MRFLFPSRKHSSKPGCPVPAPTVTQWRSLTALAGGEQGAGKGGTPTGPTRTAHVCFLSILLPVGEETQPGPLLGTLRTQFRSHSGVPVTACPPVPTHPPSCVIISAFPSVSCWGHATHVRHLCCPWPCVGLGLTVFCHLAVAKSTENQCFVSLPWCSFFHSVNLYINLFKNNITAF